MYLKNPFSEETRLLFFGRELCWWCDLWGWDTLHHIKGRVSSSPLNACPIHNHICHLYNGKLSLREVQRQLMEKTLRYLLGAGYKLTDKDKEFVLKYKKDYEIILANVGKNKLQNRAGLRVGGKAPA